MMRFTSRDGTEAKPGRLEISAGTGVAAAPGVAVTRSRGSPCERAAAANVPSESGGPGVSVNIGSVGPVGPGSGRGGGK